MTCQCFIFVTPILSVVVAMGTAEAAAAAASADGDPGSTHVTRQWQWRGW